MPGLNLDLFFVVELEDKFASRHIWYYGQGKARCGRHITAINSVYTLGSWRAANNGIPIQWCLDCDALLGAHSREEQSNAFRFYLQGKDYNHDAAIEFITRDGVAEQVVLPTRVRARDRSRNRKTEAARRW